MSELLPVACTYWRLVDPESPGYQRREADEMCLSTHNYNACSTNVCQEKRARLLLTTVVINRPLDKISVFPA